MVEATVRLYLSDFELLTMTIGPVSTDTVVTVWWLFANSMYLYEMLARATTTVEVFMIYIKSLFDYDSKCSMQGMFSSGTVGCFFFFFGWVWDSLGERLG